MMKTVIPLICLTVVVLLSGCYKSGGLDPDGSDTHSDTVPDIHPDVIPDPVHDTWPDFEPDIPTDVPPDVFPDTPACMDNSHCTIEEFCEFPDGSCVGPGTCMEMPMACPGIYAPVCGCNGATYGNDCTRQAAGVSLRHGGECASEPCFPGDPYGVCERGEFCEGPEGLCDLEGVTGWCQVPDDYCGWLYDPVCGCDEVTYSNYCERQRAGVWLDYWGPCGITPERPCGPMYPPCAYSEFCEFPPGDCGWDDDSTGICTLRPMECSLIYDPVCGCNGITYSNDCLRQSDGAALLHRGVC